MAQPRLFTVTELANELGMTARAVRFYEDKGLISPRRAGTTRVYSGRDRARMILILRGKRLGFSLSTIKEYLDLYDADITQHAQLRLLLTAVASRRDQLVAQRQAIDDALSELVDISAQAEAALSSPAARGRRAAGG
ncbi:MerR family transcriptional regulator [Rhodopila sp.]|uniref:MerR family transcriptional regulator n=1 Tax=Rhodopila sp. TaxID=2480087 RepID=UPI003D11BC67